VLIRMVESGEALEWHRESHLKRAVLSSIFQTIIDVQYGSGADHTHHSNQVPIVKVTTAQERRKLALQVTRISRPRVALPRVHLLEEYAKADPALCAQVADKLRQAELEVLSIHEEGVPIVVLLSPEILRDAAARGRLAAMLQAHSDAHQGGGHAAEVAWVDTNDLSLGGGALLDDNSFDKKRKERTNRAAGRDYVGLPGLANAVYLYSTAVPFDYYLKHCPRELKDLGLFNRMFDKFPMSLQLQLQAATLVADRLLEAADGNSGENWGEGSGHHRLWQRRVSVALWWLVSPCVPTAQREAEMPWSKLLHEPRRSVIIGRANSPPGGSRKGPADELGFPSGPHALTADARSGKEGARVGANLEADV
jgi:hypothetical protein